MTMTLQQIETRLQELERTIQRDQLASNAFSLNAKGELEETLSGKLEAKGVIFQEGQLVSEADAALEWVNGGVVMERITGSTDPAEHSHTLTLSALAPAVAALRLIGAEDPELNQVGVSVGSTGRLLLDANGDSNWLQLGPGVNAQWCIYAGLAETTFAGGTQEVGPLEVTVPFEGPEKGAYWFACGLGTPSGVDRVQASILNGSPTAAEIVGWCPEGEPGAGVKARFYWLAITF
jgi:hypothetical protein